MLVREHGGIELLERGGAELGVLAELSYEQESMGVGVGDALIIYTDGLIESRDEWPAPVRTLPPDNVLVRIRRSASAHVLRKSRSRTCSLHGGGAPPQRRVTLVVIRGCADSRIHRKGRDS